MKSQKFNNLILGFCFNNKRELPTNFIKSFTYFYGEETQLIIFVNFPVSNVIYGENIQIISLNHTKSIRYRITKRVVHKYGYSRLFRFFNKLFRIFLIKGISIFNITIPIALPVLIGLYPINVVRFFFFLNFFKQNSFKQCLITDTTDVIFQGNVFKRVSCEKVHAFAENKSIKLKNEQFNYAWITKLYGSRHYFKELSDQEVYCCGTILFGSLKAARSFLKLFAIECLSENMAISYSGKINSGQEFSFKTPYDAAEQGIFNKMVFLKEMPFHNHENGDVIYTIGTEPRADIILENEFIFKRGNPIMPAVIHQYNRHPDLLEFVKRKYGR
jgi:hypothetical protein